MSIGDTVGPYRVLDKLGEGGMGEVYRARDTKLNRDVAIKVLPEIFAADPDRLLRFEREAHVLASLNHPHIAQVYAVIDRPPVLVMELVGGEDLAQRLTRGAVPVREALELARQIADALQGAHESGVVHRDLKPANVRIRDDGTVKVLDFGLAKIAVEAGFSRPSSGPEAGLHHPMNSPTFTSPAMTQAGMILGTAAYMAPEQAKGKPVDRGADLWAFGAVFYEMLVGQPAFAGETVTDMLAAIVTRDPDWSRLPPDTPAGITRLLKRCLERDRRRRLADAGEARYQIEEALASPPSSSPAPRPVPRLFWRAVPWGIAALAVVMAAVLWFRQRPSAAPETPARYTLEIAHGSELLLTSRPAVGVSADASTVVFAATRDGVERIYVRGINSFEATPIAGTEGGSHPVISPDGAWVAFVTNTKLLKVPITGGPVVPLADVNDARGLSWDSNETITYTPSTLSGVFQVPAGGGQPAVQVTKPKPEAERTHRWPQQLPGGALLYTVGDFANPDSYDTATIAVFVPRTGERRTILSGAAMARYVPSGHLVFLQGTTLFGVPFDHRTLEVRGTAVPLLQSVATDSTTGAAHFSVSRSGSLVYVSAGGESAALRPMEVDRNGRTQALPLPLGVYSDLAVSPDGEQLAYVVAAGGGRDIWVYERARKSPSKLTSGGQNMTPVWSHEGATIYYVARQGTGANSSIVRRPSDGSRDAEEVVRFDKVIYLDYLNPDGRTAVIEIVESGASGNDIYQVALSPGARPAPVLVTPFVECCARLSPDGRWMAYVSFESGRAQVYRPPRE